MQQIRLADFVSQTEQSISVDYNDNYPKALEHQGRLQKAAQKYKLVTTADMGTWIESLDTHDESLKRYEELQAKHLGCVGSLCNDEAEEYFYLNSTLYSSHSMSFPDLDGDSIVARNIVMGRHMVKFSIKETKIEKYENLVPSHAIQNLKKAEKSGFFDSYVVLDPDVQKAKVEIVDPILCGKVSPYRDIFFIIDAWHQDILPVILRDETKQINKVS